MAYRSTLWQKYTYRSSSSDLVMQKRNSRSEGISSVFFLIVHRIVHYFYSLSIGRQSWYDGTHDRCTLSWRDGCQQVSFNYNKTLWTSKNVRGWQLGQGSWDREFLLGTLCWTIYLFLWKINIQSNVFNHEKKLKPRRSVSLDCRDVLLLLWSIGVWG